MSLAMVQYLEVNLLGLILLALIFFCSRRMNGKTGKWYNQDFSLMLICNALILLADCGIYLLRGHTSPLLIGINYAVCCFYYLLHPLFGALWLRYSQRLLYPGKRLKKSRLILLMLPLLVSWLMTLASPWTKQVFSLTAENRYLRGSGLVPVMGFTYFYWVLSLVLVIREMLHPKQIRERFTYISLLIFPIPTVIGAVLQLCFYGISVIWIASAVSLLFLFINLQNYTLSRDLLTGLFNRRQTSTQLTWEIEHLKSAGDLLFVLMIDMDYFKSINDRFGHLVGDRAIAATAALLKKSCLERDFVSRFGGDEFLILGHTREAAGVEKLIGRIHQNIDRFNLESGEPYRLSLSCGYAVCSKADLPSIDSLIRTADQNMYAVKARRPGPAPR